LDESSRVFVVSSEPKKAWSFLMEQATVVRIEEVTKAQ
jgi:hypothetical protein